MHDLWYCSSRRCSISLKQQCDFRKCTMECCAAAAAAAAQNPLLFAIPYYGPSAQYYYLILPVQCCYAVVCVSLLRLHAPTGCDCKSKWNTVTGSGVLRRCASQPLMGYSWNTKCSLMVVSCSTLVSLCGLPTSVSPSGSANLARCARTGSSIACVKRISLPKPFWHCLGMSRGTPRLDP